VEQSVGKAKALKIKNINFDLNSLDKSVSNGNQKVLLLDILAQYAMAFNLANYRFEQKTVADRKDFKVEEVCFFGEKAESLLQSSDFTFYERVGHCKNYARDLANGRANTVNTEYFLEEAKLLTKLYPQVELKQLVGEELLTHGLNMHHAVGRASSNPPILINLTYRGNPDSLEMHSLVGKGLTFDSGGLHVKPYGSMEDMYIDKAGASAMIATLKGIVQMGLKINITTTLGMAENFISNNAYRPSDIIKSHQGLTVEVKNTDAEGRLVLADAMSWTQKTYPEVKSMIELSTLTGACMVALGERTAGLFSNNDQLSDSLFKAGAHMQEGNWKMPITPEIRDSLKGTHCDLVHISGSRYAGASVAAAFLENFVSKGVDWAHLDIAGPALASKPYSVYGTGATGFGVGTLLQHFKSHSN
jgi:leucyl aminopeptidase